MSSYLTKNGDMLDDVVSRYYGDTDNRIVERVLEANKGLADYGPVLPAGLRLIFPSRPTTSTAKIKFLWS